jgi:hypothetical protein
VLLDPEAAEYREELGGLAWVWQLREDVMATRIEGFGSAQLMRFYTARADAMLERSQTLYVFHHWAGVRAWDPDVRHQLRAWAAAYGDRLVGTHFLVRSPLLAMAIEVAGMALGRKLLSHRSEATFFAALQSVLS